MSAGKAENSFRPSLFSSLSLGTDTDRTSVIRAAVLVRRTKNNSLVS